MALLNKNGNRLVGREWLTEHFIIMAKRLKWCIVNRFPNSDLWGILESFDTESGDNLTGAGDGDDETITVDFSKLDPRVNAILFVINIYQGKQRGQNFGQVKNPKARLYYSSGDVADLVYELDEDFDTQTTMEFCMLYKHNDEWKFKAIGEGNENGLTEELRKWGIPAEGNA